MQRMIVAVKVVKCLSKQLAVIQFYRMMIIQNELLLSISMMERDWGTA